MDDPRTRSAPATGGHLFVVHGDLRALHCDHWLLPVDAGLHASRSWNGSPAWRCIRDELPDVMPRGQRVVAAPWDGPRRPWPTDVASGKATPAAWQAESVRQFLEAAVAAPRTIERARPLLALPIVGTGYGGKRRWAGDVLRAVLPEVYGFLRRHDADVALVTWTEEDFAASQAARAACEGAGTPIFEALGPPLRSRARELAELASRQRLVVFMGAGVSASAGVPTWSELLDRLAADAGFTDGEREGLRELGPLDRAQVIARRLPGDAGGLGHAVRRCLDVGDAVALSHTLLAGLPVREYITTNYDDCFERACASVGRGVARLPYAPASGSRRWLLKMHGCVTEPDDIVLTRQDYVRYAERNAALAGIVQAMLITRHMLFVGFSLDDDNFHRIVDAVRRALDGSARERLGSVVALFPNALVEQLWGDDLDWVHVDVDGTRLAAARRFEIFLDALSFHATAPHHLLNPRFDALLSEGEQELRDALAVAREGYRRRKESGDAAVATAWEMLGDLLWELGDRGGGRWGS